MAVSTKFRKFLWGIFVFVMFLFFFVPMVLYWLFGFSLAYPFEEAAADAVEVIPLAA